MARRPRLYIPGVAHHVIQRNRFKGSEYLIPKNQ